MNTNILRLFHKALMVCSIVFVFVIAKESLWVAAVIPQLIAGEVVSTPMDALRDIEAVHQADLQAKAAKANKANKDTPVIATETVQQASVATGGWNLSSSRVIAVGAGAVVGAVALNYITSGTLTTASTGPALATIGGAGVRTVAASSTAVSVYALVGAVIGGIAGNYLYNAIE